MTLFTNTDRLLKIQEATPWIKKIKESSYTVSVNEVEHLEKQQTLRSCVQELLTLGDVNIWLNPNDLQHGLRIDGSYREIAQMFMVLHEGGCYQEIDQLLKSGWMEAAGHDQTPEVLSLIMRAPQGYGELWIHLALEKGWALFNEWQSTCSEAIVMENEPLTRLLFEQMQHPDYDGIRVDLTIRAVIALASRNPLLLNEFADKYAKKWVMDYDPSRNEAPLKTFFKYGVLDAAEKLIKEDPNTAWKVLKRVSEEYGPALSTIIEITPDDKLEAAIELAIRYGASPLEDDGVSKTPLATACMIKNVELSKKVVEFFIKIGAHPAQMNVNKDEMKRQSEPGRAAMVYWPLEEIQNLLPLTPKDLVNTSYYDSRREKETYWGKEGVCAIEIALRDRNRFMFGDEKIKWLANEDQRFVNMVQFAQSEEPGLSSLSLTRCLSLAIFMGLPETSRKLCEIAQNNQWPIPSSAVANVMMMFAGISSEKGNEEKLKALTIALEMGVELNTPFHSGRKDITLLECLFLHIDGLTPFHEKLGRLLVKHGADPYCRSLNGEGAIWDSVEWAYLTPSIKRMVHQLVSEIEANGISETLETFDSANDQQNVRQKLRKRTL